MTCLILRLNLKKSEAHTILICVYLLVSTMYHAILSLPQLPTAPVYMNGLDGSGEGSLIHLLCHRANWHLASSC